MKNFSIACRVSKVVILCLLGLGQIPLVNAQSTFQKTYKNVDGIQANSVALTSDSGIAISGWYNVDGFGTAEFVLLRADSNGNKKWASTYGEKIDKRAKKKNGSGNECYSILETLDKGFLLVGEVHSFGAGKSDVYLVKIDNNGDTMWSRTYGGIESDYGESAAATSDSGFVITGFTESFGAGLRDIYILRLNALGDTLWTKTLGGVSTESAKDIAITSNGDIIITGFTFSYGAGNADAYLAKIDKFGNLLWEKSYGGLLNDYGYSVDVRNDAGYIISGATESFGAGEQDVYVIKTDSNGNILWSKTYGGERFDTGNAIQETSDRGFIIAGSTNSFNLDWEDAYLIKLDSIGDTLWTQSYGGAFTDIAKDVKQYYDNGYIMVGYTQSFGFNRITSYVIRTDSLGVSGCHQRKTTTTVQSASSIQNTINSNESFGGDISRSPTVTGNTLLSYSNWCDSTVSVINKILADAINIYPNPAYNFIKIELNSNSLSSPNTIELFRLDGQLVKKVSIEDTTIEIDISDLTPGIYLLSFTNPNGKVYTKIIKE